MKIHAECETMRERARKALSQGAAYPVEVQRHGLQCEACRLEMAMGEQRLEELGNVIRRDQAVEATNAFRMGVMTRVRREEGRREEMRRKWGGGRAKAEFEALMEWEGKGLRRALTSGLMTLILLLGLLLGLVNLGGFGLSARVVEWCSEWSGLPVLLMSVVAVGLTLLTAWWAQWLGDRAMERVKLDS